MPKYAYRDGDDLTEPEALSLDFGVPFVVTWEANGESVECVRLSSPGTWDVGRRSGGQFYSDGTVVREGHMHRAV